MGMNVTLCNRLRKLGLITAAEFLKEEIRIRIVRNIELDHRPSTAEKSLANDKAIEEMWTIVRPICEAIEADKTTIQNLKNAKPNTKPNTEPDTLRRQDDIDGFLDPDYSESDPGKWLRDGILWTAAEIRRVVIDSPDGPSINLELAHAKPPTAWAVFCLEFFARLHPAKRGEQLIARVLPFATKLHSSTDQLDGNQPPSLANSLLDSID